jgi:hypothetical protein
MGVMGARRVALAVLLSVCAVAGICVGGAGIALAEGSFQFGGPEGDESGQLTLPHGLAIDGQSDAIYAGEFSDERVSKFDGSGSFLFASGWGVIPGANGSEGANEFQTCTSATGCFQGRAGGGDGEFASSCGADGVAVDNDPLSASYKDVYVGDFCNYRVQKFDPSGKFLLMFGGHVNATTGGDVCVAGEACQAGTPGTADGEFEWSYNGAYIAVGPGGAVYVGDKARVQVFEASGAWREDISLSALSAEGKVTALAVNSAGDVYVKDEGVPGVREFEPGGIEMPVRLDEAGGEAVEAIALDAEGDVFISESGQLQGEPCRCDFQEYSPVGQELKSFGAKTLISITPAMAFDDARKELYVYGGDSLGKAHEEYGNFGVWAFTLPAAGPLVEPGSETGTPEQRGAAKFEGLVNPEGSETTVYVEYVDDAHFRESGYASATSTVPILIGSEFTDQHVEVVLPQHTLTPGVSYHWRISAHNSQGTNAGPDQSFQETPPALVEGPWVAGVASTSATFAARIDPLGVSAEYRIEYGTSTSYGHVLTGNVGEGTGYVTVSHHRQDLQPGTLYHYRVVTVNEVGTVEGTDHTFTTQPSSGNALALPDGRAWELVSPANKQATLIEPYFSGQIQAATGGSAITYVATQPVGENPIGQSGLSQILSTRAAAASWRTQDISIPYSLPREESAINLVNFSEEVGLFSPDLSLATIEPHPLQDISLSPEASERTDYIRDNASGTFTPLVNDNNVSSGTKYGGKGIGNEDTFMHLYGESRDLRHIVLGSPEALTPEAQPPECENSQACQFPYHLFEWSAGQLQLVSILPDGESAPDPVELAPSSSQESLAPHAVSSDGRRIVWLGEGSLFMRDMVAKKTMRIASQRTTFETMSSDGSRVFFLENGDLYKFDVATQTRTDLTADRGAGEPSARVEDAVLGASEDGSYVYFVARGVLAGGATGGEYNLYLLHDTASGWTTTYVTTLSREDGKDWFGPLTEGAVSLNTVSSRVSPDGHYLAFMSERSLTGYDNVDAVSGQPDEEVYLYDAVAGRLTCASCNPTGARPVGVLDTGAGGFGGGTLMVDRNGTWAEISAGSDHWLAGSIPGWRRAGRQITYQPRYLSDGGRLFFNSSDALVPQDTNGLEDVYEYEPAGVGGCASTDVTFNERSGGCVNLLSSGTSNAESAFMDASENGDDAFFATLSRLTAQDYDNSYDVYDAHVCSGSAPCVSAPVSPPPCSSGDSCKAAPSPQPEIFGPAPSATFSGAGNVVASPSSRVSPKALTRAQKLARALTVCHKKSKKKRAVCERQAGKRYGAAKRSGKANATRKDHR